MYCLLVPTVSLKTGSLGTSPMFVYTRVWNVYIHCILGTVNIPLHLPTQNTALVGQHILYDVVFWSNTDPISLLKYKSKQQTPIFPSPDITLANPLHEISGEFDNPKTQPNKKSTWKPGHRKTHSLSMLEGFNTDQEKAGTALLLVSPLGVPFHILDETRAHRSR